MEDFTYVQDDDGVYRLEQYDNDGALEFFVESYDMTGGIDGRVFFGTKEGAVDYAKNYVMRFNVFNISDYRRPLPI